MDKRADADDLSATFSEHEVAQLLRLLGCAGAEAEPVATRRLLFAGLADLIAADTWLWTLVRADRAQADGVLLGYQYGGPTSDGHLPPAPKALTLWSSKAGSTRGDGLSSDLKRGRAFARAQRRSLGDHGWRHAVEREADLRDCADRLLAGVPAGASTWNAIAFDRRADRSPFDARTECIVRLVLDAASWLQREPAKADGRVGDIDTLPPRPRSVLLLLLDGLQAKEVAQQLGLSPHTVRQYIKQIYRTLGVSSRGELFSHFARGHVSGAPRRASGA